VLCFLISLSSRPAGEIFEHVVLIKISRFARNDIIAMLFRKRSTKSFFGASGDLLSEIQAQWKCMDLFSII